MDVATRFLLNFYTKIYLIFLISVIVDQAIGLVLTNEMSIFFFNQTISRQADKIIIPCQPPLYQPFVNAL